MDPLASREVGEPVPEPHPPPEAQLSFPASSALNRGRMPLIPEEPEEFSTGYSRWPRNLSRHRTQRVSPLTMYNFNNTDIFHDTNSAHANSSAHKPHTTHRDDDFKDYECCPQCYGSQLVALCRFHNLPTEEIELSEPAELPVPLQDNVRPFEAYVHETDKVIKELLAEIADREKANSN